MPDSYAYIFVCVCEWPYIRFIQCTVGSEVKESLRLLDTLFWVTEWSNGLRRYTSCKAIGNVHSIYHDFPSLLQFYKVLPVIIFKYFASLSATFSHNESLGNITLRMSLHVENWKHWNSPYPNWNPYLQYDLVTLKQLHTWGQLECCSPRYHSSQHPPWIGACKVFWNALEATFYPRKSF